MNCCIHLQHIKQGDERVKGWRVWPLSPIALGWRAGCAIYQVSYSVSPSLSFLSSDNNIVWCIWKLLGAWILRVLITRKKNYNHVRWWMLTKLTVVITSQYIHILNHYVVYLKLIQCYLSSLSQQNWENHSTDLRVLFFVRLNEMHIKHLLWYLLYTQ